jgi:hypothetical protein
MTNTLSDSFLPVILKEAKIPAAATEAVPVRKKSHSNSLQQLFSIFFFIFFSSKQHCREKIIKSPSMVLTTVFFSPAE